ncbi:MAG: rhomboid family protein [Syntrophobacteraceae bacterium]
MSDLSRLRCFNHANREAVARCLQCSRTFCRECITEHEERVICAQCLAAIKQESAEKRTGLRTIVAGTWCLLSATFLWAVYYYFGKILLTIPSSFHESVFGRAFQ